MTVDEALRVEGMMRTLLADDRPSCQALDVLVTEVVRLRNMTLLRPGDTVPFGELVHAYLGPPSNQWVTAKFFENAYPLWWVPVQEIAL